MSFVNPGWGFLVVGSMRKGETVLGILWSFATQAPEFRKKFVSKMRRKGVEIEYAATNDCRHSVPGNGDAGPG
jgi:hypothetical protein